MVIHWPQENLTSIIFFQNGGDMLRLNMAVPPTPRNSAVFKIPGIGVMLRCLLGYYPIQESIQLPGYKTFPNMDGFPNGRRSGKMIVNRIELQAGNSGVVLAAIGCMYGWDYFRGVIRLFPQDLLGMLLTYTNRSRE
jgi:hypothetical protein